MKNRSRANLDRRLAEEAMSGRQITLVRLKMKKKKKLRNLSPTMTLTLRMPSSTTLLRSTIVLRTWKGA